MKPGNSIENNALPPASVEPDDIKKGLFADELSAVLGGNMATNGKFKPLELATEKSLSPEVPNVLSKLNTGPLVPDELSAALNFQQENLSDTEQSILKANESAEEISQLGHPDVMALLKSNINRVANSEGDLLNNQSAKIANFNKNHLTESIQQMPVKNELMLGQMANELDYSQQVKELFTKDSELHKELITQTNRQESNTVKLVDQLNSLDKSINTSITTNNHTLKTSSNLDSSVMMNRIEVPVTQKGWSESVGNRLMMMVNSKIQSANIHLNPAELGPIEVRVNVNQDHTTVHFVSNNSIVRDAIEEAFPRLKEMFSENGLSLADANVSQESFQQSNRFSNESTDSLTQNHEESADNVETEPLNNNKTAVSIGLLDHYV